MFIYGRGGGVGWCATCGSLSAPAGLISLIAGGSELKSGGKDYYVLIRDLFGWYQHHAVFPSTKINEYADKGELLIPAEKMKYPKALPQNKPGSVICHVSVTRWCMDTGYASGSSERSERCARVAGDCAAKTIEMLNDYVDGKFKPAYAVSENVKKCRVCHYKGKNYDQGQWSRGRLNCTNCHVEIPKIDMDEHYATN